MTPNERAVEVCMKLSGYVEPRAAELISLAIHEMFVTCDKWMEHPKGGCAKNPSSGTPSNYCTCGLDELRRANERTAPHRTP